MDDMSVYSVFIVAGQSNAAGYGSYTLTASSDYGEFYDWNSNSQTYRQFVGLADPVYISVLGSAWPWFADRFYSLSGRKSIIVNIANGGSSVTTYDGSTTTNTWANDGVGILRSSRESVLKNLCIDLNQSNKKYRIAGILWCQGEAEAGRIYSNIGNITADDYKIATISVWQWLRTICNNQNLPVIVSQIGYSDSCFTDSNRKNAYEQIQTAQDELSSLPNVYMGFTGAKNFYDSNGNRVHMSDTIHYDEAGYKLMGEALAAKAYSENIV